MNVRQTSSLIGAAAVLAALGCAAILVAGLTVPVRVAGGGGGGSLGKARGTATSGQAAGETRAEHSQQALAELQQLCDRDLRRPLFDPPPQKVEVAAASRAPMTLSLVGIVKEPGHSMAMFRKNDGAILLCGLGESVDDAGGAVTVTGIDQQKVTIRYGGAVREVTVVPPPASAPAP